MAFRRAQGTILPLPGRVVSTTANFEKVDNVCWCLLAASVLILFDCNAVQALETACIRAQLLHTVAQTEATVAVSGQLQYWTLHANAAEGTLPTSLSRGRGRTHVLQAPCQWCHQERGRCASAQSRMDRVVIHGSLSTFVHGFCET